MERQVVMQNEDIFPKMIRISTNSNPRMSMTTTQVTFSQSKKAMVIYVDSGIVTLFWEDGNWEIMTSDKLLREFTVVDHCTWNGYYSPTKEDALEFLNIRKHQDHLT
jgi:hypothetical protein